MPNCRYHSVATVCKLSLGSPMTRAGDSRRSLFVGINRAKTRRTWKPTESAQVWSSSSSRPRANTLLNEIRTSLPKRSTHPSSIVQSRCASVPSAWKSLSKRGSIHPVIILCLCSNGMFRNKYGATDGLGILLGLNHLSGKPLHRLTMFRLCAELEGHPDNAAPATFGGFTVVQTSASVSLAPGNRKTCAAVQRFDVASRLYFILLVPDLQIETARARRIF